MALPVPQQWFARQAVCGDVTVFWEPHVHWFIRANFFHLRGFHDCILVDSGLGLAPIGAHLHEFVDRPAQLLMTHGHYDHIGGAHEFADRYGHADDGDAFMNPIRPRLRRDDFGASLLRELEEHRWTIPESLLDAHPGPDFTVEAHQPRSAVPYTTVEDGDEIEGADRKLRVIHLPGHSPGSVGFFEECTGYLFSGDVIYDGPLIDSLAESNRSDYIESMLCLRQLPITRVFPGHGPLLDRARMLDLIDTYLREVGADE